MVAVLVVGARGAVARAAVARLGALGHAVHAAEAGAPDWSGADVVLDLGGPEGRRDRWRRALDAGADVVSASLDPSDLRWARQEVAVPSRAGRTIVPCGGAGAVLADLLAARAAAAAGRADEVHTAHLVAERGSLLRVAGPGLRRELAALVGQPAHGRRRGGWEEVGLAEERRLAWFARPVGPHHAAMVPAPEVLTIAEHVASAGTVRGHLAMSTWQAELVQGLGALAQRPAMAARLRARLTRPARRRPIVDARWAVVAEASGEGGVARAWANGRDPAATTAAVLAALVARLGEGGRPTGVPSPAVLVEPGPFLDGLAEEVDLRWSVIHPDPG